MGCTLRTGLFHEALFEIVPGDEGHKLGEEKHTLTPCLPPRGRASSVNLAPQPRGKFAMGRMHMVIFGMDATLILTEPTTAPQMSAELINTAESWYKDLG